MFIQESWQWEFKKTMLISFDDKGINWLVVFGLFWRVQFSSHVLWQDWHTDPTVEKKKSTGDWGINNCLNRNKN